MCTECEAKERELLYIHKEHARVITENHQLRQRVDELARENVRLVRRICDIEQERFA